MLDTMQTKIKTYWQRAYDFVLQFRDVRAVGLVFFLVIVLMISWSGVKTIETNYQLQRQISGIDQENQVQELANNNLQLQNQYYQTNEYLELAARQNFGLAAPGETVLNVPKTVAMSHTVDLPDPEATTARKTVAKQPTYQRNLQAWMNFLLHRPTS
jgi:cell division protein FtsL